MCSLQPLQAKGISNSSEVCARLSSICVPIMAMSSAAMLSFFAVLLAFVKNGDGVREPPQAASMLETEVTLWGKDGCAKFGAKKKSWWQSNTCQCPNWFTLPRNCEGTSGHTFNLKTTIKEGSDCHCEDPCEKFGAVFNGDECSCPSARPRATKE